jgi:Xaa-Pro aminopeptidase
MTEPFAEDGARPYDVDYPEAFTALMRTGWLDLPLSVDRHPAAENLARRRAAVAAAIPGEFLVVPAGRPKIRSNDTFHPFRPSADFAWLTGEHEAGSVVIIDPDGGATLYVRPHSDRDSDAFYRNAAHGELWVGRRPSLPEKTEELGIPTADLAELPAALARLAPASTRVLRGLDPSVDAAVRRWDSGEAGARETELAATLSELRLAKEAWEIEQLQQAIDATVLGFGTWPGSCRPTVGSPSASSRGSSGSARATTATGSAIRPLWAAPRTRRSSTGDETMGALSRVSCC